MMRDIPGWEKSYAVTEDGRVWSKPRTTVAGDGVKTHPGRWMTPHKFSRTEHLRVYLSRDGKKKAMMVHRLVASAFLDNPESLPVVNHLDGDPTNNHMSNLEWITQSGNCAHAVRTGLTKLPNQVGVNNSSAKLSEEDVVAIRSLRQEGVSVSKLARMFNVARKTVNDAVTFATWKHLQAA